MGEKARVLYISYDGMTDPLGQSQVIPYLAGLSRKGYRIHLLSCEKKKRFAQHQQQVYDLLDKAGITWHPISYTARPPVVSTIYDIRRLLATARRLHKEHGFSLVHCRSYIAAFAGLYLKKQGVRFVFDMRGFWADERVEGGLWNLKNPVYRAIYKYFKRKERQYLLQADHVITLTEKAKQLIQTHFGLYDKVPEISVTPCCADTQFFSENNIDYTEREALARQLTIKQDDLIITYSGSLGTWYMLDEMLDFFKQLSSVFPKAKFLFITHDEPEKIFAKAKTKNIDTAKILIHRAFYKQMPVALSLTKVALFFILPVYSKQASSPTKMGEIMSMGIPFITNSGVGDVDTFVEKTGAGLLVGDFTKEAYARAISKIPGLLKLNPADIRILAMEEYSLDYGISVYYNVYEQLTAKPQPML